jgi:hypothetical protein
MITTLNFFENINVIKKTILIIDEIHILTERELEKFKNYNVVGFTGTPINNSITDNFRFLFSFFTSIEINWKVFELNLSTRFLGFDKKPIIEESKKISQNLKNFCFTFNDFDKNLKFEEFFILLEPNKENLINNCYTVKDSFSTSKLINYGTDKNISPKIKLLVQLIKNFKQGIIICNRFPVILMMIKNYLEIKFKNYNFIIIDGKLNSKKRNEIVKNLDYKKDILFLSSTINYGLNLNKFNILVNLEIDINFSVQYQCNRRIIRLNNENKKLIFNFILNIKYEIDKYILNKIKENVSNSIIYQEDIKEIKIINDKLKLRDNSLPFLNNLDYVRSYFKINN